MDSNAYTAAMAQSVVNLITGIGWPAAVLILAFTFRGQVRGLLDRLVEAEGFGIKAEFERATATVEKAATATVEKAATATVEKAAAETSAQVGQASATGTAFNPTVRTRESLVSTIAERLSENPSGAVVASYVEVEKALRTRMEEAKVAGADSLRGDQLVDLATRENVIPSRIAAAVRSLLSLRNLAVHGKDIDVRTALAFLSLCDTVIYSIENWPRQSD